MRRSTKIIVGVVVPASIVLLLVIAYIFYRCRVRKVSRRFRKDENGVIYRVDSGRSKKRFIKLCAIDEEDPGAFQAALGFDAAGIAGGNELSSEEIVHEVHDALPRKAKGSVAPRGRGSGVPSKPRDPGPPARRATLGFDTPPLSKSRKRLVLEKRAGRDSRRPSSELNQQPRVMKVVPMAMDDRSPKSPPPRFNHLVGSRRRSSQPFSVTNVFSNTQRPTTLSPHASNSATISDTIIDRTLSPNSFIELEHTERQIWEMEGDLPSRQEAGGQQLSEKKRISVRESMYNGVESTSSTEKITPYSNAKQAVSMGEIHRTAPVSLSHSTQSHSPFSTGAEPSAVQLETLLQDPTAEVETISSLSDVVISAPMPTILSDTELSDAEGHMSTVPVSEEGLKQMMGGAVDPNDEEPSDRSARAVSPGPGLGHWFDDPLEHANYFTLAPLPLTSSPNLGTSTWETRSGDDGSRAVASQSDADSMVIEPLTNMSQHADLLNWENNESFVEDSQVSEAKAESYLRGIFSTKDMMTWDESQSKNHSDKTSPSQYMDPENIAPVYSSELLAKNSETSEVKASTVSMSVDARSSTRTSKIWERVKRRESHKDEWSSVTDPTERRKRQNRLAQRRFRDYASQTKDLSEHDVEHARRAGNAYAVYEPDDHDTACELTGSPWGSISMRHIVKSGRRKPWDDHDTRRRSENESSGMRHGPTMSNDVSGEDEVSDPPGKGTEDVLETPNAQETSSTAARYIPPPPSDYINTQGMIMPPPPPRPVNNNGWRASPQSYNPAIYQGHPPFPPPLANQSDGITASATYIPTGDSFGPGIGFTALNEIRGTFLNPDIDDIVVNPWDLEFRPNPVIFPHLQVTAEDGTLNCDNASAHSHIMPSISKASQDAPVASFSALLVEGACSSVQTTRDLPMDVDQTTCEDSIEASSPPTSQDTSSTAVTSPSSTSSPRDPIGVSKTQFACSDCGLAFRTAGLRNKHVNRKHVRRFACTVADCTAAFHLSADLKRHQLNVHKETHDTGKTWMCTNQRCSNPNVVFKRKDNYTRHLLRCTGTAG